MGFVFQVSQCAGPNSRQLQPYSILDKEGRATEILVLDPFILRNIWKADEIETWTSPSFYGFFILQAPHGGQSLLGLVIRRGLKIQSE